MSHRPFASIFVPLFALAPLASAGCASAPDEASSSTSGEALSGVCTDAITRDQFLSHFAPGATWVTVGTVTLDAKTRYCQPLTGCTAWAPSSMIPIVYKKDVYSLHGPWEKAVITADHLQTPATGTASFHVEGTSLTLEIASPEFSLRGWFGAPFSSSFIGVIGAGPIGDGTRVFYDGMEVSPYDREPVEEGTPEAPYPVMNVGEHCILVTETGRLTNADGSYQEYAATISGEF